MLLQITHVDMRKCGTGMEGARQLHKMLKRNHPPLKSLFLFQVCITGICTALHTGSAAVERRHV